MSKQSSAVSKC